MRVIIERVTCDRCGHVADFEKYNEGTKMARIECLTSWLASLGWRLSDGIRLGDVCPQCCRVLFTKRRKQVEKTPDGEVYLELTAIPDEIQAKADAMFGERGTPGKATELTTEDQCEN